MPTKHARIRQGKPHWRTVTNQTLLSRRLLILITVVGAAFGPIALNSTFGTGSPLKRPDRLVLRGQSIDSLLELSVDLEGPNSRVELSICESPDRFGGCEVSWKRSSRRLAMREREILASMAIRADLFGGRSDGGQIDLAYGSLEVRAGQRDLAILITSANVSFTEEGPRKDLLEKLLALRTELKPKLAPVHK